MHVSVKHCTNLYRIAIKPVKDLQQQRKIYLKVTNKINVRFEVYTAVAMKNVVFWDVTPCGSCKNRRFGGT
jgi:hypothetical protein